MLVAFPFSRVNLSPLCDLNILQNVNLDCYFLFPCTGHWCMNTLQKKFKILGCYSLSALSKYMLMKKYSKVTLASIYIFEKILWL